MGHNRIQKRRLIAEGDLLCLLSMGKCASFKGFADHRENESRAKACQASGEEGVRECKRLSDIVGAFLVTYAKNM